MGEGWETARRRDPGNDWVEVSLACEGVVALAELDTSWFLGNAPGQRVADRRRTGRRGDAAAPHPAAARHPAPVRAGRRRPACGGCGWTSSRTAAWPGCGCGGGPPRPAGPRSAGGGSTRCPTSRRWRCSARSGCRPTQAGPLGRGPPADRRPPAGGDRANWSSAAPSLTPARGRRAAVPGCSSAGAGRGRWPPAAPRTLSAATVAKGAEDALQQKVGTRPDITCPKDLDATVGATTRCTLTVGKRPGEVRRHGRRHLGEGRQRHCSTSSVDAHAAGLTRRCPAFRQDRAHGEPRARRPADHRRRARRHRRRRPAGDPRWLGRGDRRAVSGSAARATRSRTRRARSTPAAAW